MTQSSQNVYIINIETRKKTQISFDGFTAVVGWSPDSKYVFFSSGDRLKIVEIGTLKSKLVAQSGDYETWSHDCKYLAGIHTSDGINHELRLYDFDTGTEKVLLTSTVVGPGLFRR